MNKQRLKVKHIDYYYLLIYNFGLIIPIFLIFEIFQLNLYVLILIILLITGSSQLLFRRYFYADFDTKLGILNISWSKNIFQKKRKDRIIKYSDIISLNQPIDFGFYPKRLTLQIKNHPNFKIFNPIFSVNDDFQKFIINLNKELTHLNK